MINKIWDENESRFIFNPMRRTINFNKARPTDYVLNKHINLPKPLPIEKELECEIKRRELLDAYKKFKMERGMTNETKTLTFL